MNNILVSLLIVCKYLGLKLYDEVIGSNYFLIVEIQVIFVVIFGFKMFLKLLNVSNSLRNDFNTYIFYLNIYCLNKCCNFLY